MPKFSEINNIQEFLDDWEKTDVDLEPIRYAEWIVQYDAGGKYYQCSNCVQSHGYREPFCPSCGSKMKGADYNEQR